MRAVVVYTIQSTSYTDTYTNTIRRIQNDVRLSDTLSTVSYGISFQMSMRMPMTNVNTSITFTYEHPPQMQLFSKLNFHKDYTRAEFSQCTKVRLQFINALPTLTHTRDARFEDFQTC